MAEITQKLIFLDGLHALYAAVNADAMAQLDGGLHQLAVKLVVRLGNMGNKGPVDLHNITGKILQVCQR